MFSNDDGGEPWNAIIPTERPCREIQRFVNVNGGEDDKNDECDEERCNWSPAGQSKVILHHAKTADLSMTLEHIDMTLEHMDSIRNSLPWWMYRDDVANEYYESKGRSTFLLGPAIPTVRLMCILGHVFRIAAFLAAMTTASCDRGSSAKYPVSVMLLVVVPYQIVHSIAEVRVLRFYVQPFIDMKLRMGCNVFQILGCSTTFTVWAIFCLLRSTSNTVDEATDSGFAAATWKGTECPNSQLANVWAELRSPFIPLGPRTVVLLAWMSTFVRSLFSLFRTMREGEGKKCFSSKLFKFGHEGKGKNIFGDEINNEAILRSLGDASGMATIIMLGDMFVELKATNAIKEGRFGRGQLKRILSFCQQMTISRMFLSECLETFLQLNLQITLFGISLFLNDGTMAYAEYQALFCIVIGIISAVVKLLTKINFIRFIGIVSECLDGGTYKPCEYDPSSESTLPVLITTFRKYVLFVRCLSATFALAMLYIFCKCVAIFWCTDYVWNLTGCAQLHRSISANGQRI